ncbi:Cof-type HAD-IIB family hydrolase [Lactobacillus gigeriorum]|uniref:Phosphatase YidA n=1 Tax=Lactobacillus gigeriorum DSM 23908 = CRBIP 24.85 TaxID=1423751 RepID=I7K1D9_9LACO|nr:Cof-type HAD-IIB family hydrolase [Lactobacillus gigeriorum]KRN11038.1 phosphatase YidA [Lactobacillus gigeriorum DSM 23908 = CRBIP 24.85]CCI87410.1 Phosphatase YidA [Lactobacillus gigeriorum DSM 23908 = CRBIP 24.85]
MTIKLLAFDMDGTLLNSKGKILTSSKQALQAVLAQGIKVVLCSGRPFAGLTTYLDELGIHGDDQYVITLNGAISRTASGTVMTQDLVENKYYRQMTAFGIEHHVPFNIVDANSRIITADHDVDFMVYIQAHENTAPLYIRTPDEMPDTLQIAKGCFVGDQAKLDQVEPLVRAKFGDSLYVVRADKNFLELLNPHVNKGNGLRELYEKLNISADEVIAFGDQVNDIPMFEFAKTAVCMANGSDEAKAKATYLADSNDNDGISKALAKLL